MKMMWKTLLLGGSLLLSACANTQYAGLNYATVVTPNGEEWKVISGKDQTNTHLTITRGDTTVVYSSEREDSTASLTQAMKAQTDMIGNLVTKILQLVAAGA